MAEIVRGIDECLGYQPRVVLPAGVRLTQEGSDAEEAMLCLSGQVSLERGSTPVTSSCTTPARDESLAYLRCPISARPFSRHRTTTEVTGIRITFEQLNHVIRTRPETEVLIAVLLIRSLDRRLRSGGHSDREGRAHRPARGQTKGPPRDLYGPRGGPRRAHEPGPLRHPR